MNIFTKIFGTHSDHELKKIKPIVDKILALEPEMQALSDDELRAQTDKFKARLKGGDDRNSLVFGGSNAL